MIKFFRTIRQNSLSEGKIGKYLKYAAGEILLVVIGILIALSINNWNQNRGERKIEENYITSIIEDAETDLSNFTKAIAANEARMAKLDSLKQLCFNYDGQPEAEPMLMFSHFRCLTVPNFVAQTDRTLSQLKNSGGMRLIQNKESVDAIIDYEMSFEKLSNQQVWFEGGIKSLMEAGMPIFNNKYLPDIKTGKFDSETFFKTARLLNNDKAKIIELGNRAYNSYAFTNAYLIRLREGKKKSIALIELLKANK